MRLSEVTGGLPGRLIADGAFHAIAFAAEEQQRDFLTFFERERFAPALNNPGISCVLAAPALSGHIPPHIRGVFLCERPKAALFAIHNALAKEAAYTGPSFPSRIGKNCSISPLAAIPAENVIIGDDVTVEAFAVLNGRVTVGDGVTVRSGAVIGCKGFSFSKDEDGRSCPVTDTAQVVIGSGAEIFEHACISTGIFPWEKTVIGEGTKLDTGCFVAHGSRTGQNCLLAAKSCCCGNVQLGSGVWVGPMAVISNRIRVGDRARISIGAVVTKDVPPGETFTGNFAIPHRRFLQNLREWADRPQEADICPPPPDRYRDKAAAPVSGRRWAA